MLLLIHLDAYAYEIINAFQQNPAEEVVLPSVEDEFQEEDPNLPVWKDLSYARTSVRQDVLWLAAWSIPFLFLFLRSFPSVVSVVARTVSWRVFPMRSYVAFCALLI